MSIVIVGSAHLTPTARDRAVRECSAMASASRSEDGCIEYRFSFDVDDPLLVRIYEEWASDADLAAHFTTDHFAAFGSVIAESVDGDITLTRHEVTSSGPLFA